MLPGPRNQATGRGVLYRRYWDRIRANRKRLAPGVLYDFFTRLQPAFIDYWTNVPATLPEKMLLSGLVQRHINLYFSYYMGDFPFTDRQESYRPDFILPDYRVIIEVMGTYWHSRPGMYEHDVVKTQLYIAAGYKVYYPTDLEILTSVDSVLENIPEVRTAAIHGNFFAIGDRPFDPRAALTARARAFPKQFHAREIKPTLFRGQHDYFTRWHGPNKHVSPPRTVYQMFQVSDFTPQYVESLTKYGQDWVNYMKELEAYFADANARLAYPKEYAYLLKWRGWWDKYSATHLPEVPHG